MKRPLIGVTCNYDYRDTVGITSGMGIVGQDWNFVAGDYVYILEKAGAIPVLIPVYKDCDEESIKEFLNKLDGVIISGGHDVGPEQYNTPTKGYCGTIIPQRDNHDIAVAKYFMNEIKKPILGICRGIQIMNVAAGGTLYQAVKDPGKDIEIIAKSADGVPEAIVQKNHPFSVAVQWHPEMMYDSDEQLKLLKAFVDACR